MATRSLFSKVAPQARPPEPEVVRPAQAGRNEGGAHWGARASARTPNLGAWSVSTYARRASAGA